MIPHGVRRRQDRSCREDYRFNPGWDDLSSVEVGSSGGPPGSPCGVFGNITDEDVKNTIDHLPELCAQGSTVIWTRGRFEPDLTPRIRDWFRAAGFEEVSFVAIPDSTASVGVHRLVGHPRPFRPHQRLFTFLPFEQRPSNRSRATQRSTRPSHPSTDQPA